MKTWQKTIVILAAIIYLDQHLIPWAGHYINHARDYVEKGMYYGTRYGLSNGVKNLFKDVLDACKGEEES